MNFKMFHNRVLIVLYFCGAIGISSIAGSSTDIAIAEKKERIFMRMIGHELLKCVGDETSRVLPIEKFDEHYKISFEFQFGFDPDDIISIVDHVMWDNGISDHCLVEVVRCNSEEVVHSFELINGSNRDIVACQGRILPKDCYDILVSLIDDEQSKAVVLKPGDESAIPFKAALLVLPVLVLIGFAGYSAWKKESESEDPHKMKVGALEFDKKNLTLRSNDQVVELSHKEGMLLSVLFANANETVARDEILHKVWGDEGDYVGRTLDVFISKLRKKLDLDPALKVANIRGVGYKLVV